MGVSIGSIRRAGKASFSNEFVNFLAEELYLKMFAKVCFREILTNSFIRALIQPKHSERTNLTCNV